MSTFRQSRAFNIIVVLVLGAPISVVITILYDRWTDEIGEHMKTKAQLERVEEREKNRSAENDQLRQERTTLQQKIAELERLHPILQFYGTRAKLVASYDLRKEAGSTLAIGNCPYVPCLVFTMQGIQKAGTGREEEALLTLGGVWDGGSMDSLRGFGFPLRLKKGCRQTIQVSHYNIDFVIEDDRYLELRAGIGISVASSPTKTISASADRCPEEGGTH